MMDKLNGVFLNRVDALNQLVGRIPSNLLESKDTLLLALSIGGVFMGDLIAREFKLPLDFFISAVIRAPLNAECEVAAVGEGMEMIVREELINSFNISCEFIQGEANRKHEDVILPTIYKFRKGRAMSSFKGKNILIIDDGIETGLRMSVAIKSAVIHGARSVNVAVPVLALDVYSHLRECVESVSCVHHVAHFVNTKYYYAELPTIEVQEVIKILDASNKKDIND